VGLSQHKTGVSDAQPELYLQDRKCCQGSDK